MFWSVPVRVSARSFIAVTVCCKDVLQCVAVVLPCVAVWVYESLLEALQLLQYVAGVVQVCCIVLPCVAVWVYESLLEASL